MNDPPALAVAFRTDASLDIGTGHVMRCLTLADALAVHGAVCRFICREHPGHLIEHIRSKGYRVDALPVGASLLVRNGEMPPIDSPPHAHWLRCQWETDAVETRAILTEEEQDWLVLDHYALDARWEKALHGCYRKLMVIDDLADRLHACDILLDQNLGRNPCDYETLVPTLCQRLIGPQYALLRPEFAALRAYSLQRRQTPILKRLLITMGGIDHPNATGKVIEALKSCPLPADCKIIVVMGSRAPWLEQVHVLAATMPWPTEVRVNVNNMAQLMADSDLAIGAAGSTSWERCCLGLPTLLVVLAENQRNAAHFLEKQQAVTILKLDGDLRNQIQKETALLLSHPDIMKDMIKYAAEITDGQGCIRVHAEIMNTKTSQV